MKRPIETEDDAQAERVWNLLTGVYDLAVYVPPEARYVPNEWDDNPECAALWQKIYDTCERIAAQLGTDGYLEGPELRAISESYERLMKLSGLKMFEYGQTLPEHSISAYTDRQRKELEARVSAAAAQLCDRYGIASDSPEMQVLTDAYRAMIDLTEASAYAQGVTWGLKNKKRPAASR